MTTTLFQQIERVVGFDAAELPVEGRRQGQPGGINLPVHRQSIDGRSWICKYARKAQRRELMIQSEAIAAMLVPHFGARLPAVAVADIGNEAHAWLSEELVGAVAWEPRQHATILENFGEVGAMLALDAVLLNDDRHPGNLIVHGIDDRADVLIGFAIDNDKALHDVVALGQRIDLLPAIEKHLKGLPRSPVLIEGALSAAARARAIGAGTLRAIASESCAAAGLPNDPIIFELLRARCERAESLTRRHLAALGLLS